MLGDALEALRIVAILARPAHPRHGQADLGAHRPPRRGVDQRIPGDVAWGGYPGGLAVTKGAPLFPRIAP